MKSSARPRRLASIRNLALVVALFASTMAPLLGAARHAVAADAFVYGEAVTVDTDHLNLRDSPSLDGEIVSTLSDGVRLFIYSEATFADGYSWYRVNATGLDAPTIGIYGWVAGEYLKQYGWSPGTRLEVADGPLNLRRFPGTSEVIVSVLAEGAALTAGFGPRSVDGLDWYSVSVDGGGVGWVAGNYLIALDDGATGAGGFHAGDAVIVTDGPLNLRESPSLAGVIRSVVPTGATFSAADDAVDADGYTWISVFSVGYGQGWVASDFIALDPTGPGGGEDNGPGA